jgi:hypothetical protein
MVGNDSSGTNAWELAPPLALGCSQPEPMFTNGRVVKVDEVQGVGDIEGGVQRLNAD